MNADTGAPGSAVSFAAYGYRPNLVLSNLVVFIRGLRRLGLPCTLESQSVVQQALIHVGWDDAAIVEAALCCVLVRRREHLPLFREAWRQFLLWLHSQDNLSLRQQTLLANVARQLTERHRHPQISWLGGVDSPDHAATDDDPAQTAAGLIVQTGSSSAERWRQTDFAQLTDAERTEVERTIARLHPLYLRSRRHVAAANGPRVDLRRALRQAGQAGEVLVLARKRPASKQRPVVWLCDVSGSMDPYSRLHLRFAYSLLSAGVKLDIFTFSTRLHRLTRALQVGDFDSALTNIATVAGDFSGGTRLATALDDFYRDHAKQTLHSDSIFLLSTDGLDGDDEADISPLLQRISRLSSRSVWLHPGAADPRYAPQARAAAELDRNMDDLLPAHSWRSLEQMWQGLQSSHRRQPTRAQRANLR